MIYNKKLFDYLIEEGWVYKPHDVNHVYDALTFGEYSLYPDGSSWLMLNGPKGHIFDIANPDDYTAGWTSSLIMKLIELSSK